MKACRDSNNQIIYLESNALVHMKLYSSITNKGGGEALSAKSLDSAEQFFFDTTVKDKTCAPLTSR